MGNVIGKLFLLNVVLSTRYTTFGIDIVKHMIDQRDWTNAGYVAFPRVTLCDFKVRASCCVTLRYERVITCDCKAREI
jgi:hypothetical protein